ncbi:MAG TPA: NTP transferase domain-containing protein [Terrimesophilobacter sp.]|nr:NTP transferase domain-containing protein [Terrimesophilobacter sp.]
MVVDAVVLAGGRSRRLGGTDKARLQRDGVSLLARTLTAARHARQIVVVGPEPAEPLPDGVLLAREQPPFGGPAAAIAAGLRRLREHVPAADAVLVLACDMPHIGRAVPLLLAALASDSGTGIRADGIVVVDGDGRRQPLASIYRAAPLTAAIAAHADQLDGLAVQRLVADLELTPITVPGGATADVDTWEDAAALGVVRNPADNEHPPQ